MALQHLYIRKKINKKKTSFGVCLSSHSDKGNNKIIELRTILQRKVKTHNYINRQNQPTTGYIDILHTEKN
jgi:hypothetical protein